MDNNRVHSYETFNRGSFDDLFESLSLILCYFENEGFFYSVVDKIDIPKGISSPLIYNCIKLITDGACTTYFDFISDLEFHKSLTYNISNNDLAELILAKKSLSLIRTLDVNNFFELLNSVCSNNIRSKTFSLFQNTFKEKFNF